MTVRDGPESATEDQAKLRRSRELPGLVQDRSDGFRAEVFGVAGKLFTPEAERFGISDAAKHALTKIVVGVDARQVNQGGVLARYERRDTMEEKVLQAWPP